MQGLIYDIRSFSVHDGPGIRQTVFLKGCPLRCMWCHNPESQENVEETITNKKKIGNRFFSVTEKVGMLMSVEDVMKGIEKDILFFEESGGGVTLSGGEPLMQANFITALLSACKEAGIHTATDTCGYAETLLLENILPFNDLFLFDLKLSDDQKHKFYTGVGNQLVLNNLKTISRNAKPIIIRIPLIPEITDTETNLLGLKRIIESTAGIIRIDLLPYHTAAHKKYERMGRFNYCSNYSDYDMLQVEAIKNFFNDSAPIVSIGG